MAPRMRRQHDTVEAAPVAPSTDTSMHTVSSKKKKKKGVDTHQPTLPQLVLKGPQPKVAVAESEVSLGKHALPAEEGPTSNAEQRHATAGSPEPKPAKRARAGDTQAHLPHLELSDNEETLSRLGNVPPNRVRKLKRMETLLVEDDSDDDISNGSDSKVSESESNEDEDCDDLVGFTQTAKMSKMAFERPTWLASSAGDIADAPNASQINWRHSPPDGMPACTPSTHGTLLPHAQAGAYVLSRGPIGIQPEDTQTAGPELAGTTSEGQQMTRTHFKYPQVTVSGSQGTTSEGRRAMHAHSKGHSEHQQVAPVHSACHSVTISGLKGTASEGQRAIFVYPEGYPQVTAPGLTGTTPNGRQAAHTHSGHRQVTASGFMGTTSEGQQGAQTHPQAAAAAASVARLWPIETDMFLPSSGKVRLMHQTPIVRATITNAFDFLHASIVLEQAFPDPLLINKFVQDALVTASLNTQGADDVHDRLLNDRLYRSQMSNLPRARISIFHAEVKDRCVAATTLLLGAHDPSAVTDIVKGLLLDFNYIFPRRNANGNVLVGSPHLSRPYRSPIIISVIRDLYFSGNTPFVTCHQDQFPSRQGTEGDVIWEVPKAMVGLVATGYYATLSEWQAGKRRQQDFSANTFQEAYNCHITSLNAIEKNRGVFYHNMMAEIYQLASNGGLEADAPPEPLPATLDLSMLED
ncbi:hypothetical protein EDB86DRAFT_3078043 [Lactarius hatsudake]|nr:hypothetical protein EDB86DRAFT_3078043 [Lactarius hatsudake]